MDMNLFTFLFRSLVQVTKQKSIKKEKNNKKHMNIKQLAATGLSTNK